MIALWALLPTVLAMEPCAATQLEVSLDALAPGVEAPLVVELTAGDVLDACTFEPPVTKALTALSDGTDPGKADLKGRALKAVCAQRSTDRETIWAICAIESAGIVTRAEWDAGVGPVVLPVVVYAAMLDGGARKDLAQVVFRRLAGVPARAPASSSEVIDTFEPLFPR